MSTATDLETYGTSDTAAHAGHHQATTKASYLLDPHTPPACSWQSNELDEPLICLATAHPAIPDAIEDATGEDSAHHSIPEPARMH